MEKKKLLMGAFALLFAACSNENVVDNQQLQTVNFVVNTYEMERMNMPTRAVSATNLAHLAMGVYNVDTNELVGDAVIQDKSTENYGQFSTTLPKGNYRFVFLGYDATRAVQMQHAQRIAWENQVVTNTFSKSIVLNVGNEPISREIAMERSVGMFSLVINGDIPDDVAQFKFDMRGGSYILDATTGFGSQEATRTYTFTGFETKDKSKGITINFYAFLPSNESSATITVDAMDLGGNVIRQRTFENVPMKRNTKTRYTGKFFAEQPQSAAFQLMLESVEWDETDFTFE